MRIIKTQYFLRQCKKYAKKYKRIEKDIDDMMAHFDRESDVSLGASIYKKRRRCTDTNSGSSWWRRTIVYYMNDADTLVPLLIYHKTEKENVSLDDIRQALRATVSDPFFIQK